MLIMRRAVPRGNRTSIQQNVQDMRTVRKRVLPVVQGKNGSDASDIEEAPTIVSRQCNEEHRITDWEYNCEQDKFPTRRIKIWDWWW
jgi:hypothetical protein